MVDTVHEGYLTSVNRFYSTDWDTAKCVEVVYKSAQNCKGSDAKEEVDDENDIDKEFDEARELCPKHSVCVRADLSQ